MEYLPRDVRLIGDELLSRRIDLLPDRQLIMTPAISEPNFQSNFIYLIDFSGNYGAARVRHRSGNGAGGSLCPKPQAAGRQNADEHGDIGP